MKAYGVPAEFRADTRRLTPERLARILAENASYRLPSGLGRAAVPTPVAVGEREYGVERRSARNLVAAIPGAAG